MDKVENHKVENHKVENHKVENHKEDQRKKDINDILKYYEEPDIPTDIVRTLKKKFPEITSYKLVTAEQLYLGITISLVPLDMSKLLVPARVVKIFYRNNNSIDRILLYNSYLKIFWKSNPKKYYLFKVINNQDARIVEFLKEFKKQLLKNK